jgi:tRNA acetyltransferase TAN1
MAQGLLITTARGEEFSGKFEVEEVLAAIGIEGRVEETEIRGLLFAEVEDGIGAVRKISELMRKKPEIFLSTIRYIPLEKITRTDVEEIRKASKELASKIGEEESFRITVEKRHTFLHTRDVIEAVAREIRRKVDLKNPDWIVLIEIFGGRSGISVIRPDEIVSKAKG